jgi:hypothetical protein
MIFQLAILCVIPTQPGPEIPGADSGPVAGKVIWVGSPPFVPPFRAPRSPGLGQPDPKLKSWPNPLAPRTGEGGGLADVLVWLEGEGEAAPGKRTKRPELRVVVEDNQIRMEQGGRPVPVGLLNPGDTVVVESKQASLFIVRGRGVDSFSLPLVDPGKPVTRKMEKPGWIELFSGSGQYWARAWIWVDPPAQTTFTGPNGEFRFEKPVKKAKTVVARLPDWRIIARERDPETGEIQYARYGKPQIMKVDLSGKPAGDQTIQLEFKADGK